MSGQSFRVAVNFRKGVWRRRERLKKKKTGGSQVYSGDVLLLSQSFRSQTSWVLLRGNSYHGNWPAAQAHLLVSASEPLRAGVKDESTFDLFNNHLFLCRSAKG